MNRQEQMYALISECDRSGLSLKSFCEAKQIRLGTFHYWRRKQKQEAQGAFVPIHTNNFIPGVGNIEVLYPNGITVRLNHFDLNQIDQLLKLA